MTFSKDKRALVASISVGFSQITNDAIGLTAGISKMM